jgi:hypothetical protein
MVMTSSTEIAAISAKARKNPRFCFLFKDSLSFVRRHIKPSTKRSMVVKIKK